MAVNDVPFYTVTGEEISRNILVQQMIDYYSLKLKVGETRVTDFNEGSEIRNLLEAIGVDIYWFMEQVNENGKIGFVETAEGEWLDKHGDNPAIKLPRIQGEYARGIVKFSVPSVQTLDITIGASTLLVCEETGLEYITDNDCTINVGETSATVGATCITTGYDGNCGVGKLNTISDTYFINNLVSVTNEEAFVEGVDYEDDDQYRERLLEYIRKDDFGSRSYYEELGRNVDGVHDVILIDDLTYTAKVLVNGDVKPTPNTVLLDTLVAYTDTPNLVLNHTFTVDTPDYVTKNFTLNAEMYVEIEDNTLKNILTDYINGGASVEGFEFEGLYIGEGINKLELYSIFEIVTQLSSIEILVDGTELDTIELDSSEVLKIGTITVNQTVIE